MKSKFILERVPYGWLLRPAHGMPGLPIDALSECAPLFGPKAHMHLGIAHHYNVSDSQSGACIAIASMTDGDKWRNAIEQSLLALDAEERWWRGTDVGASSAAIFAVLAGPRWRNVAKELGGGSTPRDGDDFGRCKRLVDRFPGWRCRLEEVAAAYPATKWSEIVRRWDEMVAASPAKQSEILARL